MIYHVGFIGIGYDLTEEDVWGEPDIDHKLPENFSTQVEANHEDEAVDIALNQLSDETGYLIDTIDNVEVYPV